MKAIYLFMGLLASTVASGQRTEAFLAKAMNELAGDRQFKHAILSLYVVNSKTGKVVYDKNSQVGLAPASCQKLFTSASAFELLGKTFCYRTEMGYTGSIIDNVLEGDLFFSASGDPTLGSWRWDLTNEDNIKQRILNAVKAKGISAVNGNMVLYDSEWESQATPRGWTWEDIGNYYGAGARGMNWHENQYDLILRPGKRPGDSVRIIATKPALQVSVLVNELRTGEKGSGDNSIIYLPEEGSIGYLRGTVPAGAETFTVSGSIPNVAYSFMKMVKDLLESKNIKLSGRPGTGEFKFQNKEKNAYPSKILLSLVSPPLDSINYWFLKKSINLYGEALVKTIAYEKTKFGSTDTGIAVIRDFWVNKGIEGSALKIIDGSGLSPANRITTHALVSVMQYAKQQSWFPSFYHALPEINGIRMKDGYISGVRSYTGFVSNKKGDDYIFSFIVNNFDGSPGTVREKMWKLLDILK